MSRDWVELAVMVVVMVLPIVLLFGLLGIAMGGYVGSPVDSATYNGEVESVEEDKGLVFEKNEVTVVHGDDAGARTDFCVLGGDAEAQLDAFRRAADGGHDVSVEYYSPYWVNPTDCSGSSSGTIKIVTDVTVSAGDAE